MVEGLVCTDEVLVCVLVQDGSTPTYVAACKGHDSSIVELVKAGAHVNKAAEVSDMGSKCAHVSHSETCGRVAGGRLAMMIVR